MQIQQVSYLRHEVEVSLQVDEIHFQLILQLFFLLFLLLFSKCYLVLIVFLLRLFFQSQQLLSDQLLLILPLVYHLHHKNDSVIVICFFLLLWVLCSRIRHEHILAFLRSLHHKFHHFHLLNILLHVRLHLSRPFANFRLV